MVGARFLPDAGFQTPARGWLAGAGRGAAAGLGAGGAGGAYAVASVHPILLAFPPFALAILALAGAGATIGGVAGAVQAEAPATVEEAEAALKNALAALKVQEAIRDRVVRVAQQETRHPFLLLGEQGPTTLDEKPRYDSLAREGIDTVLEVGVLRFGLEGPGAINPPLALLMTLRTRLVRVADAAPIYEATFEYKARARTFAEWAVNGAQPFREELDRSYQTLAEKVVEELFLLYLPPE